MFVTVSMTHERDSEAEKKHSADRPWSPGGERTVAEGIFIYSLLAHEPWLTILFGLSELRLARAEAGPRSVARCLPPA